jgi:isopentenyl-diphosphate delta-isomerase
MTTTTLAPSTAGTTTLTLSSVAPGSTPELDGYDEEQVRLMEERCILVNEKDEAYGEDSKKTCEWGLGG